MRERQNIDDVNSVSQHQISLSASRSHIQKLESHIKSTLPHLQGRENKKYIFMKIHNSFKDNKQVSIKKLEENLQLEFDNKIEICYFKETKELLSVNYSDNELHYIIVPEKYLSWAETFARQERDESDNKKKIYVYGILKKSVYTDKLKARSKKKVDKVAEYIEYFEYSDQDYPARIVQDIQQHLDLRLRQEGNHVKTWAITNKFAGKKVKRRTLHFFYDECMEQELTGMYKAYKKKSKSSWIQIYRYQNFEDVLKKIRQREMAINKEVDTARKATSRILLQQSRLQIEPVSMKSAFNEGMAQLNSSLLSSSVRAINKLDQNDVNIIICYTQHPDLQKFRALVRAQKNNNWHIWEIEEGTSDFLGQLKDFLNEEMKSNEQLQAEEYQRIIHSKTLFVLALSNDSNTIDMFNNQRNVLHNLQLLLYNDVEEFFLLLRQGVRTQDDFVIAVVPGGFKSFATEYAKVIADFDAKYKNVDCVENYKFISNANGRHVSNIASSNLLGTQSNLTYFEDNTYLENIMRDRDKHFHPFQGLKGHSVYLLIKETIQEQLDDLRNYISNSPRLHISTYIDKEFLKQQIMTITLKDSVIIITDDSTLREAQAVARSFDEVCILNITDRQNPKEQVKVISSAKKAKIYDLIKQIPENDDHLESEIYEENNAEETYLRKNRVLPKKISFRPGDTISIRLPSDLNDEESHKMEIRLQRYFNKQVKIEYYKQPRDIRLVNKLQEPLSFVIWADYQTESKEQKQKRAEELEFIKQIAQNQIDQLREQFIIYSQQPRNFASLTQLPAFQRFKFVSNRWQRIQEYIIGSYKNFCSGSDGSEDFIYNDEMIRVFFNDKDKTSKDLVSTMVKRRDGNDLNAANHTQCHILDDLPSVLAEQSPYHKYFVVLNQQSSSNKYSKDQLMRIIAEYRYLYMKLILIRPQKAKRIQATDERVRKVVPNYNSAGEWICGIKVYPAKVDYVVPHIIIDKSALNYYYFLDKYSRLTRRFTFSYCESRDEVKKEVMSRKDRPNDQIWVICKDPKTLNEYIRILQRTENYKNVKFICEFGDNITSIVRPKTVFKNQQKKQIEKFILNIYRRDKRVFFPSSVSSPSPIVLAILPTANGKPIAINRQQISNWEDLLKAKVQYPSNMIKLQEIVKSNAPGMVYAVYPWAYQQEMTDLCNANPNLRRILLATKPEFDSRLLRTSFVENNNKIYIGTYPAEITEYLRLLRYNIRKPQALLEKSITNEIMEVNIQKQYKLTEQEIGYLTAKNDSIIVNSNGYDLADINNLLNRSTKFNHLQIFIGDQQSGKVISDFNDKKNKDVRFIDLKASPLIYMKGEKGKNYLLQTNERDQLVTYLYNLPENRYAKALNNRGKFTLYCDPKDITITYYLQQLAKIRQRNPKIQVKQYNDISQIGSVLKEPGVILIHNLKEKEYVEKVKPVNNINYMILNEEPNSEKNYASYGNKYFITRQPKDFQNFMNQLTTTYQANLQPIDLHLDQSSTSILSNIKSFASAPVPLRFFDLQLLPPLRPKSVEPTEELNPIELIRGVIDEYPPTLLTIDFPKADIPSLPLGLQILRGIKNSSLPTQTQILKVVLDVAPSKSWFNIKSDPDSSTFLPKSIAIPKPAPPMRLKLAVLHPNTPEFDAIGEVLKSNLQPDQYIVSILPFKSEHELQDYSKNNGQRLNGYDKIVVFLSNLYRKYDNILRVMKSKLNNRMEYFIFDDNFHVDNHAALKNHLRPYRIKNYALPYINNTVNKFLVSAPKIVILVPQNLLKKYEGLKGPNVTVQPYILENQIHSFLHKQNCFVILVSSRQNYHNLKLHAKVSPRCMIVIDTLKQLPQDQLYLYRIPTYALYYGPNASDYIRKIIPAKPQTPTEEMRLLYFGPAEEQLVFQGDYGDYQRIFYRDWNDLYRNLMFAFKGKNNNLIKNSPVRPQIIPLHPRAYLQNRQYMKDFKNNFIDKGYLNQQRVGRKSGLVVHEYSDLPETFYGDDKDLAKLLEKQQSPSVVLCDASNRRVLSMRMKFARHKWIAITDHSERWIDPEGNFPEVTDDRLLRKQDMFANMFNNRVFDQYNDMQYYYLSNKAHIDHNRNIYFRTKEQLAQIYADEKNMLMVVFVEAKDVNHIPQSVLAEASEEGGRVKLILLKTQFLDDFDTLYIKFNEIDPVIKHINDVQAAGRIDFIVYNEGDGEKTRQTLIQRRKLRNFQNKPFNDIMEIDEISRNIKGRYKKVFVICFPDEKTEIESCFASYSIQNKGIPNQGVQFVLIDRLSSIRPNPSHISKIRQNSGGKNEKTEMNISKPQQILLHRQSKQSAQIPYIDTASYSSKALLTGNNNIPEERTKNSYIEEEELEMPDTQSNIKPNKMEIILANKNFVLNIDEKLKGLFPVGKFFTNKVNYFTNPRSIPTAEEGVAQFVISTQANPEIMSMSEDPETFVVVVGRGGNGLSSNNNTMVIAQQQIPGLIKRLEGSGEEDEFGSIRNIDDYDKVRVIYDKGMDLNSKRRLLAVSKRNKKIYPTIFKGVDKLKEYMSEPDSLLLLMMSYDPQNLESAVAQQNKVIVKRKKVKMILPQKSESDIDGLETILQQQQADQDSEAIKKLTNDEVDVMLKIYENTDGERPPIVPPAFQEEPEHEHEIQHQRDEEPGQLDYLTKLNVHSNIHHENIFRDDQIDKIKQRLTGDLIVLIVDKSKRDQADKATDKYNVLIQGYTNSMNLQTDIRDRKDDVTLAVIDRNMLDKIPAIKKKYPHTAFILQSDNLHDEGIEQYRPYLSGQIRKIADLEKIVGDIYLENDRIRYNANAESIRAASRFDLKRTSIVDFSNNERFTVGLSNQKSKKMFLFYKEPDNTHIKFKLSETFNNINFISYRNVAEFKRIIGAYNTYTNILIGNGSDIPQLEDFVSKKKEMIYVVWFNPPTDMRDNGRVKMLCSTFRKEDLEKYLFEYLQKYSLTYDNGLDSKFKSSSTKNVEGKRYIQKYEPNTFGTTPRFPGDFVPPKSKESTYSRKYLKSMSRSKLTSRLEALSPKTPRNLDY